MIRRSSRPHTRRSLGADLRALGLRPGGIAMLHASLSAMGYVTGGPVAVLQAVIDVLGEDGTLVLPAQSADLTDPGTWRFPAVPPDWVDTMREDMPAYDPARTPTWRLGVIAELFRTWPGVQRSAHPICSFSAYGRHAGVILEPHAFDDPFGEQSPLGRLYDADAQILLIGTGWTVCTALHLAERRADPDAVPEPCWSPILAHGERRTVVWCEYPHDNDVFRGIGEAMEAAGLVTVGIVGDACGRLAPFRSAVDFGTERLRGRLRS